MSGDVDVMFRRLAARGYFEIHPAEMTNHVSDGHGGTISERPRPAVWVQWWPRGQRGNPFCSRSCTRRTIGEALEDLLARTEHEYRSIEDAVADKAFARDVGRWLVEVAATR